MPVPPTGVGNCELSRELGIVEPTVKAHILNIVAKLGQQTRTQVAIVSALAHNALSDEPSSSRHLAPASGRGQKQKPKPKQKPTFA
ncbi:LuxR C-terminal-related transcriptional regulator [Streptomyces sp. NPDC049590]|uniref:LuxR C-terminal-related transcriptional regulator n=1 Tax=Streptomyces sp. NPDC049590 TaxID=3154834 RepID=UPI0034352EA2